MHKLQRAVLSQITDDTTETIMKAAEGLFHDRPFEDAVILVSLAVMSPAIGFIACANNRQKPTDEAVNAILKEIIRIVLEHTKDSQE